MILAFVNNKGGVAKTTSCVSIAAALARSGRRVLVVDLDSQASASFSLGVGRTELAPSVADVLLRGEPLKGCVRKTATEGLDLVTATMDLANADLVLGDARGREGRLRAALRPVGEAYDYVLLDCPPSLGLVTINALMAADGFVVPVTPQYLALEGLVNLLAAVERMREGLGMEARLLGLVVTMADYRLKSTAEIVGMLREHYGRDVCGPEVRVNVRLSEAPSFGRHIFDYDAASSGAEAYAMLARELVGRCRQDGKTERRTHGTKERRAVA